jgi:TRAP-type C4-dicarboxylate transport system permease small subunit
LPAGWRRIDVWIIRATEAVACLVGFAFTALISAEVFSRYILNFSIFAANAASLFMLVWFFMLGAGLALRMRGHVGFEILVTYLPPLVARAAFFVGQILVFLFFVAMFWSGIRALPASMRQTEAAMQITYLWVMLSFPFGFALLIYHQAAMVAATFRAPTESRP